MATFLSLLLCLSLSMTAFASEASSYAVVPVDGANSASASISPRAVDVLISTDGLKLSGSVPFKPHPSKGKNLKLTMACVGNPVKVTVKEEGKSSTIKSFTVTQASGTKTYDLVNNCSGKAYVVTLSSSSSTVVAVFFQTEYV